jgi:antitoxin HicB
MATLLMDYPITLERDDDNTYIVSFPDFPEAHTFGDTPIEAVARAKDALATIIDAYIKDRRDIPAPSAKATRYRVPMPALIAAKVRLYEAMREGNIGKAELARRLDWHLPQVDRLFEMTNGSKLEQLESAFGVLGKRLVLEVQDGAPFRAGTVAHRDTRTAGAPKSRLVRRTRHAHARWPSRPA